MSATQSIAQTRFSRFTHRLADLRVLILFFILFLLAAWWFSDYQVNERARANALKQQQELDDASSYLAKSIIGRLDNLHEIAIKVGNEPEVREALNSAVAQSQAGMSVEQRKLQLESNSLIKKVSQQLLKLTDYANVGTIFVLNADGDCILASNATKAHSFVGYNFHNRDYYKEAISQGRGYQYAMGRVSNVPGLYFSTSIRDNDKIIGVSIIKINLPTFSPLIGQTNAYLVDELDVIIYAPDNRMERKVMPGGRALAINPQQRLRRYKLETLAEAKIIPWKVLGIEGLYRVNDDKNVKMIASKKLRPGLTLKVIEESRQLTAIYEQFMTNFVVYALLGLLLFLIVGWRLFVTKERLRTQQRIEESESRLNIAQGIAHVGSFDWFPQSGELFWSDEHFRLWGIKPGTITPTYEIFRSGIHPDDVDKLEEILHKALEGSRYYDHEHRVINSNGKVRFIHGRGEIFYNRRGDAERMLGTVQDVTERKRNEAELIATRNEAERANRAKSEFLSSMSHELRTPMNAILGFGQLLDIDESLSEEQHESVKEIISAGRHLIMLIDEVLDLAKIESGKLTISKEPVDVSMVLDECMTMVTSIAQKRDVSIVPARDVHFQVNADRTRLKQSLLNLLSNAIKYNCTGGKVTIEVKKTENDRLRISVQDTGAGIAKEKQADLFQPFSRLGAENSTIEGVGIGLNLTRKLVELMDGQVGFNSEQGVGSTFWIDLKLTEDKLNQEKAGETDQLNTNVDQATHSIVYIEDNPSNLKLVQSLLDSEKSIRLYSAHTAELGIELIRSRKPDLIVLDINLPGMDGFELLKVLKADESTSRIPVIALTANAMPGDIERGKAAGFNHYLTKPLDVRLFNETIKNMLV